MIKAIIFDIDGVLIDSFDRNLAMFREILRQAGYKKLATKAEYKNYFHFTAVNSFKSFTGSTDKKEIDRLMGMLRVYKHTEPLKIMPGSEQVIKLLSKKYKLALVTSRIREGVDHYLAVTKHKKQFKVIVQFGDFKKPKPNPESLLIACQKLKIKPNEAIYIGDALTDVQAAKAAKMPVILFSKKRIAKADGYAQVFSEIPKIISTMN